MASLCLVFRSLCCVNVLQKQINAEEYALNRSDVEKQIAAHNILHQEIEAYSGQLQPAASSQVTTQHALLDRCRMNHFGNEVHFLPSSLFLGGLFSYQREIHKTLGELFDFFALTLRPHSKLCLVRFE